MVRAKKQIAVTFPIITELLQSSRERGLKKVGIFGYHKGKDGGVEMKISGFVYNSSLACKEQEKKDLRQWCKDMNKNKKRKILNVFFYDIYLFSGKKEDG